MKRARPEPPLRWRDERSAASPELRRMLEAHEAEPRRIPPMRAPEPRRRAPAVLRAGLVAAALAAAGLLVLRAGWSPPLEPIAPGQPPVAEAPLAPRILSLPTGDRVELGAHAVARAEEERSRVELSSGRVLIEAEKRGEGEAPLVVDAGAWTVTVLGTRFSVERRAGEVRVEVDHGHVRVDGPRTIHLRDGERFDTRDLTPEALEAEGAMEASTPKRALEPPAPRPRRARNRPARRALGAAPASASRSGPPAAPQTERPAAPKVEIPSSPRSPTPSSPRSPTPSSQRSVTPASPRSSTPAAPGPEAPAAPRAVRPSSPRAEAPASPRAEPPAAPRSEAPAPPRSELARAEPSTPRSDAELIEAARRSEDPARALEQLRAVIERGGAYAELASYRAARIALREGWTDRAIAQLEAHLERWPRGELRDLATEDGVMALLRSGRTRAAERFLARATPAPLEDPSSAFLQGEIERSRGAWAAAARAYAAARAGPRAEQSTFLEALCLGRAGDRAGARRGMQAFLRAFPSGRFADRARAALGEMNP